jgi:hypothetical protein
MTTRPVQDISTVVTKPREKAAGNLFRSFGVVLWAYRANAGHLDHWTWAAVILAGT